MKFKVGDKVKTRFGKFKVIGIDAKEGDSHPCLCYQKGFDGHSGGCRPLKEGSRLKEKHKGYLLWFDEDKLKLIIK